MWGNRRVRTPIKRIVQITQHGVIIPQVVGGDYFSDNIVVDWIAVGIADGIPKSRVPYVLYAGDGTAAVWRDGETSLFQVQKIVVGGGRQIRLFHVKLAKFVGNGDDESKLGTT